MGTGLMRGLHGALPLALCGFLAACGGLPASDPIAAEAARAAAARAISETAARVAASKIGARVCREMVMGIAEREWIRATVVAVAADRIRVRVDDPGRFPQTLHGIRIARNIELWDTPLDWKPCS